MDLLVDLLLTITRLFGGNLGLALIFIGVASRIVFFPLLKSSYKHLEIQRQLKPKLDEIKKKYAGDKQRLNQEQAKLMLESGFNPLVGCLAPLVQLIVALILFSALNKLLKSGVDTSFWIWDLAKPDTFRISGIGFDWPGILVVLTAVVTLIQSKMMLPEPLPAMKDDSKKELEKKEDLAEALVSSQGQFVLLFPLILLFTGRFFPSGIALYWLVNTFVGLIQQYYITGLGGLKSWLKILKK
jgi:YidC/Oxa1 family membrane protein insertase